MSGHAPPVSTRPCRRNEQLGPRRHSRAAPEPPAARRPPGRSHRRRHPAQPLEQHAAPQPPEAAGFRSGSPPPRSRPSTQARSVQILDPELAVLNAGQRSFRTRPARYSQSERPSRPYLRHVPGKARIGENAHPPAADFCHKSPERAGGGEHAKSVEGNPPELDSNTENRSSAVPNPSATRPPLPPSPEHSPNVTNGVRPPNSSGRHPAGIRSPASRRHFANLSTPCISRAAIHTESTPASPPHDRAPRPRGRPRPSRRKPKHPQSPRSLKPARRRPSTRAKSARAPPRRDRASKLGRSSRRADHQPHPPRRVRPASQRHHGAALSRLRA